MEIKETLEFLSSIRQRVGPANIEQCREIFSRATGFEQKLQEYLIKDSGQFNRLFDSSNPASFTTMGASIIKYNGFTFTTPFKIFKFSSY